MFGRENSDASRRFVTWGIEIYNQIKELSILKVKNRISLQIFPILTFGREDSDASRRFGTWGIESYNQLKGLSILKVKNRISLQIFPTLMLGREDSDASRRFDTWWHRNLQSENYEYVSGFRNPDDDSRNGGARYVA